MKAMAPSIADITTGRATMFASLARPGIVDEARTRLEMQAEFHCFFSRLARPETCSSAPKICSLKPLPLEAQFHSGKARPARSAAIGSKFFRQSLLFPDRRVAPRPA